MLLAQLAATLQAISPANDAPVHGIAVLTNRSCSFLALLTPVFALTMLLAQLAPTLHSILPANEAPIHSIAMLTNNADLMALLAPVFAPAMSPA